MLRGGCQLLAAVAAAACSFTRRCRRAGVVWTTVSSFDFGGFEVLVVPLWLRGFGGASGAVAAGELLEFNGTVLGRGYGAIAAPVRSCFTPQLV